MRILVLLAALACSTPMWANDTATKNEFKEVYAAYQRALHANNTKEAKQFALQAHRLGSKVYGPDHINTGKLSLNYGVLASGKEAEKALRRALKIYEEHYGETSPELIDPLMELASLVYPSRRTQKATSYIVRAEKIAETHFANDPILLGGLQLEFGQTAMNLGRHRRANGYFEKAKQLFQNSNTEEAKRLLADAHFWSGKLKLSWPRSESGEQDLLASLAYYQQTPETKRELLTNHAILVRFYERIGKQDTSTKHCLQIGKIAHTKSSREMFPIYVQGAYYPYNADMAGMEGWVKVRMTVDKNGFVKDPVVIDNRGIAAFKDAALWAVKKFRYAPRFIQGEPVDTPNVTYEFDFNSTKSPD